MRRKLTTALVGRLRVAVPCTTEPKSIQAAHDAIKALLTGLPAGSTIEFIGEPQFGKCPVANGAAEVPAEIIDAPQDGVVLREIPDSLRRVPRHAGG